MLQPSAASHCKNGSIDLWQHLKQPHSACSLAQTRTQPIYFLYCPIILKYNTFLVLTENLISDVPRHHRYHRYHIPHNLLKWYSLVIGDVMFISLWDVKFITLYMVILVDYFWYSGSDPRVCERWGDSFSQQKIQCRTAESCGGSEPFVNRVLEVFGFQGSNIYSLRCRSIV